MTTTREHSSDIAFTDTVKALQEKAGSRRGYARMEDGGGWQTAVTPDLAAFLADRDSFYLATANAGGHPYIQHRGGPKGFLKVIDETTLGMADFSGNKQYISQGNLIENDKAHIFLMDYPNRRRVKLWGSARMVTDDLDEGRALLEKLVDPGYAAKPERALIFEIEAWDVNCPQHITQRFTEDDIRHATTAMQSRIAELEAENAELRKRQGK